MTKSHNTFTKMKTENENNSIHLDYTKPYGFMLVKVLL